MNKEERAQVAAVRAKIAAETAFALGVYHTIYARQRPEEKFTGRHLGHDGQGFRATETVYLNAFYEELEKQKWRLTPEQADEVRERMLPYAGQFVRAAGERHAADLEALRRSLAPARAEAEKRGVAFSESYDAARQREEVATPKKSRIKKLTDKEKRSIEDALERMGG